MNMEMGDVSFPATIADLLKNGNTVHALTVFTDNKNTSQVHNNSWDLVPIIAKYLTETSEAENVEVFKCCQKLIDIIAEDSKPEEVLLQFIEELETAEDDTKFLSLIQPIEKVLLRVPDKRITSLAWCFKAITGYLEKLEAPDDYNPSNEEILLGENTDVVRIIRVYNELLPFCTTFVDELTTIGGNPKERRDVIRKFLVELLGSPLGLLQLKPNRTTAHALAEKLVEKTLRVSRDPFNFLEMRDGANGADITKPTDLSLGIFYYLIHAQKIGYDHAPKVYDHAYIFDSSLRIVTRMLVHDNQSVIEKALDLAHSLLQPITRESLPHSLLDSVSHTRFCKVLATTIVHNQHEETRKAALQILKTYIWAFGHQGRYLLMFNLMRHVAHSGLKGYLITQYKEMLTQHALAGWKSLSRFYQGRKLFDLLDEFTSLKMKEESNLVDESDQIVSTLNFLRFVILADRDGDTMIDWYLESVQRYCAYLKKGIVLSRAHYQASINNLNSGNQGNVDVAVSVSGKDLLEMSNQQKVEMMQLSLTTLDVIESLLVRLTQCVDERNLGAGADIDRIVRENPTLRPRLSPEHYA